MEDEEMEFLNGICKKEVTEWDELTGTSLLNQEVVLEGAVHSIRNMGDVAFVILRRREGLFQTVVENEKANLRPHNPHGCTGFDVFLQKHLPNTNAV